MTGYKVDSNAWALKCRWQCRRLVGILSFCLICDGLFSEFQSGVFPHYSYDT